MTVGPAAPPGEPGPNLPAALGGAQPEPPSELPRDPRKGRETVTVSGLSVWVLERWVLGLERLGNLLTRRAARKPPPEACDSALQQDPGDEAEIQVKPIVVREDHEHPAPPPEEAAARAPLIRPQPGVRAACGQHGRGHRRRR